MAYSEDHSPVDNDVTSNIFSNSSQYDHPADTLDNHSTSLSSGLEQPGTHVNLTSAGRMSPHRTRTMKDQEIQLGELRKENFGLKLRIYHMEEYIRKKYGDTDKGWQMNIELQVESHKGELAEKDKLLVQAKSIIDGLKAKGETDARELQNATDRLKQLENSLMETEAELANKEAELNEARKEAEEANNRLEEMEELNNKLTDDLREKEDQLGQMEDDLNDLKQALAEREVPPATPPRHARASQTTEPYPDRVAESAAELESAQARLAERERELEEMQEALTERDRRIQEMEIKLLSMTQELATSAGDHAQQMREKERELEQLKAKICDAEDRLRDKDRELEEMAGERDAERQRARELENQIRRLQPLIQDRDREIQDLQERLADAERRLEDRNYDRDKELEDLRRKLNETRAKARDTETELAARDREIKRLNMELEDREEELRKLKSANRDLEDALSQSRLSAQRASEDKNVLSEALERLHRELEALRKQLENQQRGLQGDLEGVVAAKDAIIEQLRREIDDLQNRLNEANRRYHQLSTSTAAEIGVLKGTIEDLTRQLEQLRRALLVKDAELAGLKGEKAGLEKERDRLRRENAALSDQVAALQEELAQQAVGLEQAEAAIAELRRLLNRLQEQQLQPKVSDSELAALRGELAELRLAMRGKEEELESLAQALRLKDRTIEELQQELAKLRVGRAKAEERVRELEREKAEMEAEVSGAQSQIRILQISLNDLQDKLARAYAERDELARKLQAAEDALRDKDIAYHDIEGLYKKLSEELKRLQRELQELQKNPSAHVTMETKKEDPSSSRHRNTTMIFGNISENLLLTILQRLQELYNEITAGRADSQVASTSLSAKLEHLTALQRHLEESFRQASESSPDKDKAATPPSNTSYTTYYYMRGEGEEESDGARRDTSTPKTTSKKTSSHDPIAEINALRAELEETLRWNEQLQARLDESRRTRHVGVGMEKDGEESVSRPRPPSEGASSVPAEKYLELNREVDRLLEELEKEREKSRAERLQQEEEAGAVRRALQETENRAHQLDQKLREVMTTFSSTSTSRLQELDDARATIGRLRGQLESSQQDVANLKKQLEKSQRNAASLKGNLEFEERENRKLREELADASVCERSPGGKGKGEGLASTSSMPDLHAAMETSTSKSDSWTSPLASRRKKPDVSALKAKNEDITRLNVELQRKCQQQLLKTPPLSRPSSAAPSSSSSTTRAREREETLRSEMAERERVLLAQVRDAEAGLLEKEAEWQAKVAELRQETVELETQLAEAMKGKQSLRARLLTGTEQLQAKDEEIANLTLSLSKSQEKIDILEERMDRLLAEKNTAIHNLELRIHQLEDELRLSRQTASHLRQTLHASRGGGESTVAEVSTLHETLEDLSQQLTSTLDELQSLRHRYHILGDQKDVLTEQVSSYQDQIRGLQSELAIYIKEIEGLKRSRDTGAQAESERGRLFELLEEVAALRDQLNSSVRSYNTLAQQLRSRLGHTSFSSHTHFSGGVGGVYSSYADKATNTDESRVKTDKGSGSSWDHTHKRSTHTFVRSKTTATSTSPPSRHKDSFSQKSPPTSRHFTTIDGADGGSHASPRASRSNTSLDSSYSHTSHQEGEGSGGRGHAHHHHHHSHFTSFLGSGDFESLENRLQRALESSSLQGQDRTFLEDLLSYLRLQHQQLGDSRRLLEKLEREQLDNDDNEGGIPFSLHIGPESGTIPSSSFSGLHHQPPPTSAGVSPLASYTPPRHTANTTSLSSSLLSPHTATSEGASRTGKYKSTAHLLHSTTSHKPDSSLHSSFAVNETRHTTAGGAHATSTAGTTTLGTGTRPGVSFATTHTKATLTRPAGGGSPGVSGSSTTKSFSPTTTASHSASQTRTPNNTASYGMQTSHTSSPSLVGNSPRGVATIGVVTRTGPTSLVNGFGGRGDGDPSGGTGGGTQTTTSRAKVDLSSIYEQLLQTRSSLVEARSALNQQQLNNKQQQTQQQQKHTH